MTMTLVMVSSFGFATSAEASETFKGAGEPVKEVLSTLQVKPQGRKSSDRSSHMWNHVEGKPSSYSTRDLVLDRDLTNVGYKSNGRVKEGDFVDPYTGVGFKFEAATLSDGTVIHNPHALKSNIKRLKKAQRNLSRKQKDSNRRRKAKLHVSRLYARVANLRMDFLNKTTTMLARTYTGILKSLWLFIKEKLGSFSN